MSSKAGASRAKQYEILDATLTAALKVLDVTENVLKTTPIPGAAAIIRVILDVIKQKEVRTHRRRDGRARF